MNSESTRPSEKTRILIVDDEVPQMTALCHTLNDRGYETVGMASARAALKALATSRFDLLLSDLMMPEMDGIALLKAALEIDKNLVAVIMTGEGTIVTAVEAMKSGAFDYILKPFKVSFILPVLARALAMRQLRDQNTMLAQDVKERTLELEIANQELEAFSFTVSHDLRAPLRHIAGFAGLLEEQLRPSLDETSRHYLDMIEKSAVRLGVLIDDLLTFSRTGRAELQRTEVDMSAIVSQTLADLAPDIGDRKITFDVGTLPVAQADPSLIRQVWVNLMSNAVKYTRNKAEAHVRIGCIAIPEEGFVYSVADNGAGFDNQYADRLFGVFQRLHTNEEFEGTGVGLANVRRIVSRHGGRTWAEGKLNEGATIFFSLPKR